MREKLSPHYNPRDVENRIYRTWETSGFFNPDHLPAARKPGTKNGEPKKRKQKLSSRPLRSKFDNAKPFCIVVPPPNVTGSLHMGHALNATIQDILIRKKRMEGYKTLWLPGTDHAGIATQNVVEKELKKQGISRHDLGREKFLARIREWKERYGAIILDQFKKLGCSMDWSRTRFTMDDAYQKAVEEAFLHYHKKGWFYKAEKVINWCTRDQTSLSDLELEYREEKGKLYFIKYPVIGSNQYVVVATTRPETMLGDSAVAVNPNDIRYRRLVGKKLMLPIQNREISVIADEEIDMAFGTGAVKVTPAHDLLDARIGEKHSLPIHKVIGPAGKMIDEAGPLCGGLTIGACREKVIEELKQQNLIEKTEDYIHRVAVCYRCGSVIEPLPSMQWFLKMEQLAKKALDAVDRGEIAFHPESWKKVYRDWLSHVRDWNVSRQIWWGHRIPAWYCQTGIRKSKVKNQKSKITDDDYIVTQEKPTNCTFCNECEMMQETDVLDTWFSSALWPFATLGWPEETHDLKTFYPTRVLSTGRDIINLWVARMIFSGLELAGGKPFSDVIIHATVLTKDGKRMSKSLGTGVDPMDLIGKYGADATRFGLIWQHMGTQDMHWSEEHVMAGKKFANKLWNIARFLAGKEISLLASAPSPDDAPSRDILTKLAQTKRAVENEIDQYNFGQALHLLYDFIWHEFADRYIEYAKTNDSPDVLKTLGYIFNTIVRILHPFMPFITEEIWQQLPKEKDATNLLIVAEWPQ